MDLKDEHNLLCYKKALNKTLERMQENEEDTYFINKYIKDLIDAIQQEQEPQELIIGLRQKMGKICNLRKMAN